MDQVPNNRYTRAARWFHWLVFAFVTLAYLLIVWRGTTARGSDANVLLIQLHKLAGLAVLLLVPFRLRHRRRHAPPPIVPAAAAWELRLSRLTHAALYAFLFLQPMLGLLTTFSGGRGITFPLTTLQIPSPIAANPTLNLISKEMHVWLGTIFYFVIGLHVAGALWHHLVRRDNTLQRMT